MKNPIIIGVVIAICFVMITIFHFVHPVLVLTLKDIFGLMFFDIVFALIAALYLGHDKSKGTLVFWIVLGSICLPVSIIACLIRANKDSKKA